MEKLYIIVSDSRRKCSIGVIPLSQVPTDACSIGLLLYIRLLLYCDTLVTGSQPTPVPLGCCCISDSCSTVILLLYCDTLVTGPNRRLIYWVWCFGHGTQPTPNLITFFLCKWTITSPDFCNFVAHFGSVLNSKLSAWFNVHQCPGFEMRITNKMMVHIG